MSMIRNFICHSLLKINLDERVVKLEEDLNIGVLSSDKRKFFFMADSRPMMQNLPFATNIIYLFFLKKKTVSPVASAEDLGIMFDSNLSYNEAISNLVSMIIGD
ncbi:Hypothetical predicted protein [Paramuricea clavata]|uniref:Uncharacterized protein n=1 Tax=Paramuricea clavata TaxID=317549 RepID=A0A7D9D8V7_PARCT|nr:Hypothetical predicted protein [Paramuricea clavata]